MAPNPKGQPARDSLDWYWDAAALAVGRSSAAMEAVLISGPKGEARPLTTQELFTYLTDLAHATDSTWSILPYLGPDEPMSVPAPAKATPPRQCSVCVGRGRLRGRSCHACRGTGCKGR